VEVNADPTLKLVFICKFSPDSRNVPDPGIKKAIMPTFMTLRSKKWLNARSLFFRDLSSFVISG
jgi:hypothetical protein